MEDFVSYDIAVKLKEKGFKEKCVAFYNTDNPEVDLIQGQIRISNQLIVRLEDVCTQFNLSNDDRFFDAPTISQVLKWLRNKRIDLVPMPLYPNNIKERYRVVIWFKNLIAETVIHDKRFETWEQAAIAGIEYVLNNLI